MISDSKRRSSIVDLIADRVLSIFENTRSSSAVVIGNVPRSYSRIGMFLN